MYSREKGRDDGILALWFMLCALELGAEGSEGKNTDIHPNTDPSSNPKIAT